MQKRNSVVHAKLEGELAERVRISRDLHDRLGGLLTAIRLILPKNSDALPLTDEAIREMRNVSHHLLPDYLKRYGLRTALTDYCAVLKKVNFQYNRAVNANADGYILKNTDAGELINAIQIVADNEKYICHEALQILKTTEKKDIAILTQREKDVLLLIVNGYSEKEIADKLFLSFETIHSYTKQIRRKLNCNNTASLVRTAIQQHLYIKELSQDFSKQSS